MKNNTQTEPTYWGKIGSWKWKDKLPEWIIGLSDKRFYELGVIIEKLRLEAQRDLLEEINKDIWEGEKISDGFEMTPWVENKLSQLEPREVK